MKIKVRDILRHIAIHPKELKCVQSIYDDRDSITYEEFKQLAVPTADKVRMLTMCMHEKWRRVFARWCAFDVAHLWEVPVTVRVYLLEGNDAIREDVFEEVRSACHKNRLIKESWFAARAACEAASDEKDHPYYAYSAYVCAVQASLEAQGSKALGTSLRLAATYYCME